MARRSDHTREEIHAMALAAAERLVAEQGLTGLSARKLAAAIGYTQGTLYLVFRNLDDLILQLNGRTLDRMHRTLADHTADCGPPEQCVLALGLAYIRFAQTNPHLWGALYEHQPAAGEPLPDWYRAKVDRMFRLVMKALGPLATDLGSAEMDLAAHALWSGVHGICILAQSGTLHSQGQLTAAALSESLIRNYLSGLRGQGQRSPGPSA
jgi:AcrR family transcriptional regulator